MAAKGKKSTHRIDENLTVGTNRFLSCLFADTQVKLRETIQPLINKARGTHCEQCLSKKQLQVKLVFEIEELARQFEAEYPADEFDKVSDEHEHCYIWLTFSCLS